jgi:gas vesicle protein
MSKAKKIFMALVVGFTAGTVVGAIYAPLDGSETRKKILRLKQKLAGCNSEIDGDLESLEEASAILQKELNRINEKIERLKE